MKEVTMLVWITAWFISACFCLPWISDHVKALKNGKATGSETCVTFLILAILLSPFYLELTIAERYLRFDKQTKQMLPSYESSWWGITTQWEWNKAMDAVDWRDEQDFMLPRQDHCVSVLIAFETLVIQSSGQNNTSNIVARAIACYTNNCTGIDELIASDLRKHSSYKGLREFILETPKDRRPTIAEKSDLLRLLSPFDNDIRKAYGIEIIDAWIILQE
jgi:hypothetical protein